MRSSLRRLPPELLSLELPEPRAILSSWIIGQRTRGSLERLLDSQVGPGPRRLEEYLASRWLGIHGAVDLLAAHEESRMASARARRQVPPPRPSPTPVGLDRVERISAIARGLLPVTPARLVAAVRAEGIEAEVTSLEDLVRVYREHHVAVPFRVVRRAGASVLVAPEQLASAEALLSSAAHFIFNWGLCSVNAVVSRLRSVTGLPLDLAAATRILTAVPRFRWLDEESGWFSFANSSSRLRAALSKIFALTERVLFRDLRLALSKQIELLATASGEAIETYLSEVVGCEVNDGWVHARASSDVAALGPSETTIVAMVTSHGGEIATRSLRQQAKRQGLSTPTVLRLLRTSPLLLERGGRLRLVGPARAALA